MMNEPLPDGDHVARYCRRGGLDDNGEITPGAFMLRKSTQTKPPEDYLSVSWLECIGAAGLEACISALRQTHPMTRKEGDLFAVLNVKETRDHVHNRSADQRWLRFLHLPLPDSEPHSGIFDSGGDSEFDLATLIVETIKSAEPAHPT